MQRKTSFELHIRPMMRLLDWDAMKSKRDLDLHDYATVRDRAEDIVARLETKDELYLMPPPSNGGPWPEEWITLFKRWIKEGYPRLELIDGATYSVKWLTANTVRLSARLHASPEDKIWFELTRLEGRREYTVYREPGEPSSKKERPIRVDFQPGDASSVSVCDADGTHEVSINPRSTTVS